MSNVDDITKIKPYKVIFKYKNNEKKTQYHIYIYLGEQSLKYKTELDKIEKLNFFDTLMTLNTTEIEKFNNAFGNNWYLYFFNMYHISYFINKIRTDETLKKKLLTKYSKSWIDNLLLNLTTDITTQKSNYSYNDLIYHKYRTKMGIKIKGVEPFENNFILKNEEFESTSNILYKNIVQNGGNDDEEEESDVINEDFDTSQIENINYEEIYNKETDKKINKDLEKILGNELVANKKDNLIRFTNDKIDSVENENIENVYEKKFIFNQFINNDDTIKILKNKITASILNRDIFGDFNYIIPSRMYLWSEYIGNNKINKIMIGQIWKKNNNETLDINIEPIPIVNYENLEGNLSNLNNILKHYSNRIQFETLDLDLICDYDNYITNNEIYMIDVYNELGKNYKISDEKLKNLEDIYFKIYFPKLKIEDIRNILKYLNDEQNDEYNYISNVFENIYSDLLIENNISNIVNTTKIEDFDKYKNILVGENNIIQANLYINLILTEDNNAFDKNHNIRLDLFNIFNDFEVNDIFPFIQYNIQGGNNILAYDEEFIKEFIKEEENLETVKKWFENAPYGVSFKVKIQDKKFINVSLNEVGKIEYKIIWSTKEEQTINNVHVTFNHILKLIDKINVSLKNHPHKLHIKTPELWEANYVFINSNQKFKLPKSEIIDHNDFSNFCKNFFPYVSLIIEPKKLGRPTDIKYGTYLEYKRVSKYEIESMLEKRILIYLKNPFYDEDIFIDELISMYNLSKDRIKQEIIEVKKKHEINLSKQTEISTKIKHSGIRIDIQGKTTDKYVIKINGSSNEKELNTILNFINVLIYLYHELYFGKSKKLNKLKDNLNDITKIAKKRLLVQEIIERSEPTTNLKNMKNIDKKRLLTNTTEGNVSWTRLCQNSGTKNKRQPKLTEEKNLQDLIDDGYIYNKNSKQYEKEVVINKNKIKLIALKLTGENGNIFYTCDPKTNNDNMYVGFLTKGTNIFNECMPCCFRKDKFSTTDPLKTEFYKSCITGKPPTTFKMQSGDILYILQDTNKITEGRICYLPKFINYLINVVHNKTHKVKNLYLLQTIGYYFKLGVNFDNYSFINSLTPIFDMSISEIKNIIIKFLNQDKDELFYCSINDGEIAKKYKINDFIKLINNDIELDFYYIKDFLKIKGLFSKNGIFPIVFNYKNIENINTDNEDFYIDVEQYFVDNFNYINKIIYDMDIILFVKDLMYYYPIVKIIKKNEDSKDIIIEKFVNDNDIKNNVIDFFIKSIYDVKIDQLSKNNSANDTYLLINEFIKKYPDYNEFKIVNQVMDSNYKCIYLISENNTIIPVEPSRIVISIPFVCFNSNNNDCLHKLKLPNLYELFNNLLLLYEKTNHKLNIKPLGVFYENVTNDNLTIVGIYTSNNDLIPIEKIIVNKSELDNKNILYKKQQLDYELDKKLVTYDKTNVEQKNDRYVIKYSKYNEESYQLFRFEFSNYINNYKEDKQKLEEIINSKSLDEIEKFVLNICVDIDKKGNINPKKFLKIIDELPNISNYQINNQRFICNTLPKDKCSINPHCITQGDKCFFALTTTKLLEFIKKISAELYDKNIHYMEIMRVSKYYVFDIVNYNYFNDIKGKKILKSNNVNIDIELQKLFGDDKIPVIGKRNIKHLKQFEENIKQLNFNNQIKDSKSSYIQTVMSFKYSILRAYTNGYYWINHNSYDVEFRNLGFYSELQNDFINIFRSNIIDWLNIPSNIDYLINLNEDTKKILNNIITNSKNLAENILKNVINKYITNLMTEIIEFNFGIFELFILSHIYVNYPICLLFNSNIKYYMNQNIIETNNNSYLTNKNICINLEQIDNNVLAKHIEIIYYK